MLPRLAPRWPQIPSLDLNFHLARRMSRAAVPAMLDSGGGSLVHVGSDSGRLPEVGNQDYGGGQARAVGPVEVAGHRVQPARQTSIRQMREPNWE